MSIVKILKSKKFIIISCIILVFSFVVVPCVMSIVIYEDNFGGRFETAEYFRNEVSDFDGLKADRHTFTSNKEQTLVGYTYFKGTPDKNAVIVMAHGLGGGGHNSDMDIADYFASNGYYVFAYDATGNDESEGKSVNGLSQAVIDLDYALNYIKTDDTLKDLPVMLWGHSWGGYAVSSVLNIHKDINAVVSVSGFNKPTDIIKEQGKTMVGNFINVAMPYLSIYENFKFGKYAGYSSLEGYENSTAKVMIIHSADDTTITIENSFDVYYKKLKDNNRFTFVRLEDRGHSYIFYSLASLKYIKDYNEKFMDYYYSKGGKVTPEENAAYNKEHLDRKLAFVLDEEIMSDVLGFYDSCLEN